MFGYIMADEKQLSPEEVARYRKVYCGVCHSLKEQNGQLCRMTLTYDMTFLTLLLNSLYEPLEHEDSARCGAHPTKPQPFATSDCTEYAADATVLLAYHKLMDDRKVSRRAMAQALSSAYRAASARRPAIAHAIESGMADIRAIEQRGDESLDAAANRFGLILGCVFSYREDFWAGELRRMGAWLGKFVYLMDAVMDYDEDLKSGSYNPLVAAGVVPGDVSEGLRSIAAQAAQSFERLPLEQDIHILRNVLYAGLWGQYCGKFGDAAHDDGEMTSSAARAADDDDGEEGTQWQWTRIAYSVCRGMPRKTR